MEEHFYITFFPNDTNKDGFVTVKACDSKQVFEYAEKHFSGRVSIIYPQSIFQKVGGQFTAGCLNEVSLIANSSESNSLSVSTDDSIYSDNLPNNLSIKSFIRKKGIY